MEQARPPNPGFEQVMPAVEDANSWNKLNRHHRRAALAKMQAGRPRQVDEETGKVTPKRTRLKTLAAQVAYRRGIEKCSLKTDL